MAETETQTSYAEEDKHEPHAFVPYVFLCDLLDEKSMRERTPLKTKDFERIQSRDRHRFHCLPSGWVRDGGTVLPDLYIDFRKAFAISTPSIYLAIKSREVKRIAVVPDLYVHDLVHRYHSYLSRVGLPD